MPWRFVFRASDVAAVSARAIRVARVFGLQLNHVI
jgi:hypothetical protein